MIQTPRLSFLLCGSIAKGLTLRAIPCNVTWPVTQVALPILGPVSFWVCKAGTCVYNGFLCGFTGFIRTPLLNRPNHPHPKHVTPVFFTKPLPSDTLEETTTGFVVVHKVFSPCAFSNLMAISPTSWTVQELPSILLRLCLVKSNRTLDSYS
jgi:hypothetical protein